MNHGSTAGEKIHNTHFCMPLKPEFTEVCGDGLHFTTVIGMERNERKRKKTIIFVSDFWGYDGGGINVFNRQICENMAYVVKRSEVEVVCLVIGEKSSTEKELREANVRIVQYIVEKNKEKYENDIYESICKKIEEECPNTAYFWIGHDIKTGYHAYELSQCLGGLFVLIIHTDYYLTETTKKMMGTKIAKNPGTEKNSQQQWLANKADKFFCIGPQLYKGFQKFGVTGMLIPGLVKNDYKKTYDSQAILSCGRFELNDENGKDWEIVYEATIEAFRMLRCSRDNVSQRVVELVGFNKNLSEEALIKARNVKVDETRERLKMAPNLYLQNYIVDRTRMLNKIASSSVFIMPSLEESFGLAAWEAISLEVPIIISTRSGVYKYLENKFGHLVKGLCIGFSAEDESSRIKEISEGIAIILNDPEKMKESTRIMREKLSDCQWESAALQIAKGIQLDGCDIMDPQIFKKVDAYEAIFTQRKIVFIEIEKQLYKHDIQYNLIFFGGVSRYLIEEEYLNKIVNALYDDKCSNLNIYYCYETDRAIEARVEQLESIDNDNDKQSMISTMRVKAREVEAVKDTMIKLYSEQRKKGKLKQKTLGIEQIENRIHLVPLNKSPGFYIDIVDESFYFTLKYEKRSSQNTAHKLREDNDGLQERKRMLNHMKFILSDNKNDPSCQELYNKIERWIINKGRMR